MAETEGTIRFAYALEPPTGPVADARLVAVLAGWRAVLKRLDLIGQSADRYDGLGFGNVSGRDPVLPDEFVITASQTAGAADLNDRDLVRITHSNPARFWVDACGYQPPSSETLTHAVIYQTDATVAWVFHVHSPEIWQRSEALALPATGEDVPYGSAAMVQAVERLLTQHVERPLVFVTLGHQDGVFACGASAEAAGAALVGALAGSLA